MFGIFKKLFGAKTEETVTPAPYKTEAANQQCSDSVTQPDGNECKTAAFPTAVNDQITDSVTQAAPKAVKKPAPAKKPGSAKKPAVVAKPSGRGRKPKSKS
jgi:hypothetical protein